MAYLQSARNRLQMNSPFYIKPANLIVLVVLIVVYITFSIAASVMIFEQSADQSVEPSVEQSAEQRALTNIIQDMNDLKIKSPKPIIGILSQVLRDYKRFGKKHHLHLVASYVKWIESAGAQVIPILLNQDDSYYERMFKQTNGLLLPGGDNLLDPNKNTPMMVAAKKLYKLAVESNDRGDYYPIWGTCLGLELLSVLSSNKNVLESCSAIDEALPMQFVARGKLFAPSTYSNLPMLSSDYSKIMVDVLSSKNLTYNYHKKCLTDTGLERAGLTDFYRPLAYSTDKNNNKFITIFEAVNYPFFGVQFHPEKPPFEFVVKMSQMHIPHSRESIAVSRFFADFFVQQAQQNGHKIATELVQNDLIYAYKPMYTAPLHDMYEQRYLFPFGHNPQALTEEFIEYVPRDGEDVPEDVNAPTHQVTPKLAATTSEYSFGRIEVGLLHQSSGGHSIGNEELLYVL